MATFENKVINHVAVMIAMEAEAQPFLKSLHLEPVKWKTNVFLPCYAYQGQMGGGTVTIVINGKDKRFDVDSVGTTPGRFNIFLTASLLTVCLFSCPGRISADQRLPP